MNKALRVADYLGHILQAIERINRYTRDMDEAAFLNSELVQDAVIRNIEIIGEAANNVLRAYSTPWRTRFHADGGQCSSVMPDTVPR